MIYILLTILQFIIVSIIFKLNDIKDFGIKEHFFFIGFIPIIGPLSILCTFISIVLFVTPFLIPQFIFLGMKRILRIKE